MIQRHSHAPLHELVPPAKDWDANTAAQWVMRAGNMEWLIGYLDLVWRDFVLHDGCLLPAGFQPKVYDDWMKATKQDRTAVEAVMNHEHILDLIPIQIVDPTLDQVLVVGRVLQEMWTAKLSREFPNLSITVSFPDDQDLDDLLEYEITVFQNRPKN